MIRKIIKIDNEKCNGCGLCADACHEGAIEIIDGKAILTRDDYCDGLGNCLPACPVDAIGFEMREADEYNEKEVKKHMEEKKNTNEKTAGEVPVKLACGCPGTASRTINKIDKNEKTAVINTETDSQLRQWPVQIKLVPYNAPYFKNANLLIAADCTAYAYGNFHNEFMKNKVTLIGCPKLDNNDYSEKLTEIIKHNDIKSVTIVRMEVPCCGGIVSAVKTALVNSGKMLPWNIVIISTDGKVVE